MIVAESRSSANPGHTDVPVGQVRALGLANAGRLGIHCHKSHHTMSMGHNRTFIGVQARSEHSSQRQLPTQGTTHAEDGGNVDAASR
jgi:hypothetical protein